MENLDDIFNSKEDEESDEESKSQKTRVSKIKAGKELISLFTKPEKPEESPETDKTPELDSEAPLERLSQVEVVAISQALAEERLRDVNAEVTESPTEELVAAVSFLEAVISTGDIDEEYISVAQELGLSEDAAETDIAATEKIDWLAGRRTEIKGTEPEPVNWTKMLKKSVAAPKAKNELRPKEAKKETAGIVGFLMSRRQARLKSEAAAPLVEQDLTSEVDQLRYKLRSREGQIRKIATSKESEPDEKILTAAEILKADITVEIERPRRIEIMEPVEAEIKAQAITRAELLKIATSIEIEGTKLSSIFENNLLGEKGLRRVVAEFLRGGNVKKVLRREMIEKEIDFERDPYLRDRGEHSSLAHEPTTVESLLEKSGINWDDEQGPAIPQKAKKKSVLSSLAKPKIQKNIKPADVLLIGLILALLITLAVIILKR